MSSSSWIHLTYFFLKWKYLNYEKEARLNKEWEKKIIYENKTFIIRLRNIYTSARVTKEMVELGAIKQQGKMSKWIILYRNLFEIMKTSMEMPVWITVDDPLTMKIYLNGFIWTGTQMVHFNSKFEKRTH